ncbi:hypothetical protein [Thalassobacillus sp. CUG 92003]|uniref:hypothetical protein n=1 Tax=Thalassobacillus sp. CUG 92003 TaxID=2736641 RepID=UPI0015E65BBB|nr:hypothetical protein [Thalassobacillus sp. CUG 92003]
MKQQNVHAQILQLNRETTDCLEKIREMAGKVPLQQSMNVISYFTYSLNLSHDNEMENLSIGSYHILNVGTEPLNNPFICIKLSPNSIFSFYGKFLYRQSNLTMNTPDAWERLNDKEDKEEYWLKPIGTEVLGPSQMISFSNFQVKWLPEASYSESLMGFTYGDELKDGLAAVNQINVSGTV